ncbi:hypothetical protein O1O06_11885 [Grimontia hollisae]|uniref:hypothetical protein n=1 Tax=Grimontia hollisae TaxID=673 RepID=UPI0023DAB2AF|nr:hypothetical protein [Grimontia hollisae]MDF2185463.1 hypothetical protein [Grimontia hollisae]
MQYTDNTHTAVSVRRPDGTVWTVPRGHRFWTEWGIDTAEQQGAIQDAPETPVDTRAGRGGDDAV